MTFRSTGYKMDTTNQTQPQQTGARGEGKKMKVKIRWQIINEKYEEIHDLTEEEIRKLERHNRYEIERI